MPEAEDLFTTVTRREPEYTTGGERTDESFYPWPAQESSVVDSELPIQALGHLTRGGYPVPIAIETRRLVIVEYGKLSEDVTLDGTGAGTIILGTVPANQWWLVDNVVARAGAAGNVLLFDTGNTAILSDQDLLAMVPLSAATPFAGQIQPGSSYPLKPGRNIVAQVFGGGAAAIATVAFYYRIGVFSAGQEGSK